MKGNGGLAILCTATILCVMSASPAATGQPQTAAEEKISLTVLETTLRTLEDPESLETLKAQLRALISAQQAAAPEPRKRQAPLTRKIVRGIVHLQAEIGELPGVALTGLRRIGGGLVSFSRGLRDADYRSKLMGVVVKVVVAAAVAVALFVILRLALGRLRLAAASAETAWRRGLANMGLSVGSGVVPAVSAYVFAAVFVPWAGIAKPFPHAIFTFLDYFILYGLLAGVLRGLLAPEDTAGRICPVEDGTAAHLARRGKQLLSFAVFGYLVLTLLRMYAAGSMVTGAASVLYKIGWIAFIVVVLSHWRQLLVDRLRVAEDWEGAPRGARQRSRHLLNQVASRLYWVILGYIVFLALVAVLGYPKLFMWLVHRTVITIFLFLAGYGVQRLVSLGFLRARKGEEHLRERYPELGRRGSLFIGFLHGLGLVIVWALFAGAILETWGLPAFETISGDAGGLIVERIVHIIVVLALAALFITICSCVIERLMHPAPDPVTGEVSDISQQRKTLLPLVNKVVMYVTVFVAGIIVLDQIGINPTPILAGAGIVGLAVGFGAQTLVKDVISGFFILFENQIRVGDVAVIGDKGGLVEQMNLRTLALRDLAGNVHIIPCGSVDKVMNMTKEYSRYVLDVGVSYREDVDEVMQVVNEIFEELRRDPDFGPDIIEPLEIFGVDDFAESQVTIRTRITTKPIRQWRVAREFRRRIKKTFDERGIEIPFPHRTIYIGDPKTSPPMPLHVKLEQELESAFLGPDEGHEREKEHDDHGR